MVSRTGAHLLDAFSSFPVQNSQRTKDTKGQIAFWRKSHERDRPLNPLDRLLAIETGFNSGKQPPPQGIVAKPGVSADPQTAMDRNAAQSSRPLSSTSDNTAVHSPIGSEKDEKDDYHRGLTTATGEPIDRYEDDDDERYSDSSPVDKVVSGEKLERPALSSSRRTTEEDIFRALSRRRTSQSGGLSRATTQDAQHQEEQEEINRLLSRMFGRTRQAHSEEEKTRHVGVVFKNLTVRGKPNPRSIPLMSNNIDYTSVLNSPLMNTF